MPRVLFVIDTLEPGGAERSLLEICRHFRRYEPMICHPYPGDALKAEYQAAGVPVASLHLTGKYSPVSGVRRLMGLLRTAQPVLVHSTLFRSGLLARTAARRVGVPHLHSWVGEPVAAPRPENLATLGRRKLLQKLDALTARWVDHFVANSEAIATSNRRALGVGPERVTVIHRGRDPAPFEEVGEEDLRQARASLGLSEGDRILLNVGRLRPVKGQEQLLAAMPHVLDQLPETRLVIAGEGPARAGLEQIVRDLALEDRVLLPGHRRDIPALLTLCDVFVFPSSFEGHPGALVEAMLAGRPIVASDIPAHRETLGETPGEGETGRLVPAGDPEALAAAILQLLQDPAEARRLGEAARARARVRFDIGDIARRHEDLYDRILRQSTGERGRR